MKIYEDAAASHLDTVHCGLYFTGQNLCYLLIYLYMNTYFTDIGIPVLAVAGIAVLARLFDACTGPVICARLARLRENPRAVRWVRLTVLLVPVCAIALFSIPASLSPALKILLAAAGYLLWDTAYTLCNAPLFGMEGAVTEIRSGHTVLSPVGRFCSMFSMLALVVTVPLFRTARGGWGGMAAVLSLAGLVSMLPRTVLPGSRDHITRASRFVSLHQILHYLRGNRYLSLFYLAFLLTGVLNVSSCWGLYMSRYCLGDESILALTGLLTMIPGMILGAFAPVLLRRADKFRVYFGAVLVSVTMILVRYLAGCHSLPVYLITTLLASIPMGFTTSVLLSFTHDCAEYGRYTGQVSDPALPFATQMFFLKLQSGLVIALGCIMLAVMGFVPGEGAVQAPEFAHQLWTMGNLLPAAGMIAGLLVLHEYDLRDHDVALMQMCNDGLISREEARRQLHVLS